MKRILVRAPNHVGDQVMALPFYEGLASLYPNAHRVLLGGKEIEGLVPEELFQGHIAFDSDSRRSWAGLWDIVARVRRGQFDLGISLPASHSSALMLALAGIPRRVGYSEKGSDLLYTDALPWPGRSGRRHKSELYLDLLRWLSGKDWRPEPVEANDGARKKLIVVAPGASIGLREWPYFKDCLMALRENYPAHSLVVVGARREKKWVSLLERWGISGVQDWIGKTTLPQLISLCRKAALVISNDSGVAHVAATVAGAPTLVIFGPGDPEYVAPTGQQVSVARVDSLECSPCESPRCSEQFGYQTCLKELSVDDVLRSADSMLH